MTKVCKTCGENDQSNFYTTTRLYKCKTCIIAAGAKRIKKISSKPKWCKTCGDKNTDNFYKTSHNLICKKCMINARMVKYHAMTPEQQAEHSKRVLKTSMTMKNIFKYRCAQAKKRALSIDREFSITPEFLQNLYEKQNGKCYYSNLQMVNAPDRVYSISVERVDSNKGYVKDNVVLVCSIVNSMKRDLDLDEFLKIIEQVYLHTRTLPVQCHI